MNIKTILVILQLAIGLVGPIKELILAVELKGNGEDKAATVVEIVKAALALVPDDAKALLGIDRAESFIRKTIDILVGFLNRVGVFQKS